MLVILFTCLLMFQSMHGMTTESGKRISVRDRIAAIQKREKDTTSLPASKNAPVVPAKTQERATPSSDTKRPTVQEKPVKKGLFDAAETGELVQVINALKEHDEKTINEKNEKGWPIIAWAVYRACDVDVIIALIKAKADVDATLDDETGSTALHLAIASGFSKIVKKLIIEGKADLTVKDKAGLTAIEKGEASITAKFSTESDAEFEERCQDMRRLLDETIPAAQKMKTEKHVSFEDASFDQHNKSSK